MKKAYLEIKYHSDHSNKPRIDSISDLLAKCGYSSTCIARDMERWGQTSFTPKDLMMETFKIMDACDVAIIDLTEKGVGLGIEAGYAHATQIPLVAIAENSPISTTLLGISTCHHIYADDADLLRFFRSNLK